MTPQDKYDHERDQARATASLPVRPRPAHGGRLREAALHHRIPLPDWIDLSTGINPEPYPPPPVSLTAWARLPEEEDGLEIAAAQYYGSAHLLPVAGSQAAIQTLPALLAGDRVTIVGPTYAEHAYAWAGREVQEIGPDALLSAGNSDIVIVVNPDNPSGRPVQTARLLALRDELAIRGGWLIVDEAFIDPRPELSLAAQTGEAGLIVLRSLGKFFGLAGARVGFVLAPASLRRAMARLLGPWTLSGPAREVARAALSDFDWQDRSRERLARQSTRLVQLLRDVGLANASGCELFCQAETSDASQWSAELAKRGILVRHFDCPPRLRFGLPGGENDWRRLQVALFEIRNGLSTTYKTSLSTGNF